MWVKVVVIHIKIWAARGLETRSRSDETSFFFFPLHTHTTSTSANQRPLLPHRKSPTEFTNKLCLRYAAAWCASSLHAVSAINVLSPLEGKAKSSFCKSSFCIIIIIIMHAHICISYTCTHTPIHTPHLGKTHKHHAEGQGSSHDRGGGGAELGSRRGFAGMYVCVSVYDSVCECFPLFCEVLPICTPRTEWRL